MPAPMTAIFLPWLDMLRTDCCRPRRIEIAAALDLKDVAERRRRAPLPGTLRFRAQLARHAHPLTLAFAGWRSAAAEYPAMICASTSSKSAEADITLLFDELHGSWASLV